ncbi:hypothetical protein [Mycolicibacterium fortuitum]|uniref:hypothetical protein n=1 Tax=Mycolicibacterium fortuitum TaxID=1766 RepID=UPI00241C276C|nr:hypothetical protein [Mycolicibacterium fortuitum]MDG5773926.1 hypothetical protein [Mycolicibacterium fortuitum]MDG5779688.1 hypothetical protein [Mycolicibacterium fortuitum]
MADDYYSDAALAKQAEVDRKKAAGEPITTDDLLGILEPRDPRTHRYGLCPQQVEGVAERDGRRFYFRERGNHWRLHLIDDNGIDWANPIAEADGSPGCDEIDQIITDHLGPWTRVKGEAW